MGGQPGPPQMHIRAAHLQDVNAITLIHHESWNSSAEGLLPPATMALKTVDFRRQQWRKRLTDPSAGEGTLVADEGGTVIGFANVSASAGDPDVGEVNKLFVAPEHQGRGAGAALLRAATAILKEQGFPRAVLWSLTGNAAAAAFYRRHGWQPTGATGHVDIDQTDATLPVTEYELHL